MLFSTVFFFFCLSFLFFFFFKQKTAYEIMPSLVGSEMCIRDSPGAGQRGRRPDLPAWHASRVSAAARVGRTHRRAAGPARGGAPDPLDAHGRGGRCRVVRGGGDGSGGTRNRSRGVPRGSRRRRLARPSARLRPGPRVRPQRGDPGPARPRGCVALVHVGRGSPGPLARIGAALDRVLTRAG